MLAWSDRAVLTRMQAGWRGGQSEGTPCGSGSLRSRTRNIRQGIPALLEKYGVRSVCDAGAGDLCWSRSAFAKVKYRAFDLVPRHPSVEALDFTKQRLPDCDLIVCRQVLIHLDPPRIQAALALFREAAPLLLASQYDTAAAFDPAQQFNPTDLASEPYGLGPPLYQILDCAGTLALWRSRC